jgi:hypothetical protein
MANPVPGYRVTTPYKKPGNWQAGFHTGSDLAAPSGAKVVAMKGGKVLHVGWGGWGNSYGVQVIIDQGGGVRSAYCHLSRTTVRVGQTVSEGAQIGNVGTTGNSTGPHLHVESRRSPFAYNNVITDPTQFFGGSTSGWSLPSGTKVYEKYLKSNGHEQNDDKVSDSIKAWQDMLNHHSLKAPGNITIPLTGKWPAGGQTETVTQACQQQHGFGNDPDGKTFVGPKQFAHVKSATGAPYTWVAASGGTAPPPPPPSSGTPTYLSKLRYGQRDSDSVKNLQRALNAHKMPGGSNMPVTGNYADQTDAEVRLCQRLHGFGPRVGQSDPKGKSSVGPKQAKHLGLPDVRP